MNLNITQVKELLRANFTPERAQKINELCLFRLSQTKYYKNRAGEDNIDNWAGHKSRDDFDNRAILELPPLGIRAIKRSFGPYCYYEYQTEDFIFYHKQISSTNPFKISPLTDKYIIRDMTGTLFPQYEEESSDEKIPCFLLYEKELRGSNLNYAKICIRKGDLWIDELSYNLYPMFGIDIINDSFSKTPDKENVPPAASLLELIDQKNIKDAK